MPSFAGGRIDNDNKLYSILMSTVEQLTANDSNICVRTRRNPNKQTKKQIKKEKPLHLLLFLKKKKKFSPLFLKVLYKYSLLLPQKP